MSLIGWIDFSPEHRKKIDTILSFFDSPDVVDELGIGTVRDGLSDLLFPGTSTIHTRAKYLLIIPWCIQELERKKKFDSFSIELKKIEVKMIDSLLMAGDEKGIIGKESKSKLQRFPSSIYWNALKKYNILNKNFRGSINDYVRFLKAVEKNKTIASSTRMLKSDKNQDDNSSSNVHLTWMNVPIPPEEWQNSLSINLTKEEAIFLKNKIITSCPNTLWELILRDEIEISHFNKIEDFLSLSSVPQKVKGDIMLAVDFNNLMKGAAILYNLLIQKTRKDGFLEEVEEIMNDYSVSMKNYDWSRLNLDELWGKLPTHPKTKEFISKWMEITKSGNQLSIEAEDLIKQRELSIKGRQRSRLHDPANAQRIISYVGISPTEKETYYLGFRFRNVQTIYNDIISGLKNA